MNDDGSLSCACFMGAYLLRDWMASKAACWIINLAVGVFAQALDGFESGHEVIPRVWFLAADGVSLAVSQVEGEFAQAVGCDDVIYKLGGDWLVCAGEL